MIPARAGPERNTKSAAERTEKNIEVDFYIPNEETAIQVCYDLHNDADTYKRETDALAKLKEYFPDTKCRILTMSEEGETSAGGIQIKILPVWKWLLDKPASIDNVM